jgi:hypothetical protein
MQDIDNIERGAVIERNATKVTFAELCPLSPVPSQA